jgi:hypothetical protein
VTTYNGDIDIMHICLIWTLLVRSILGTFLLPYWDVSFVCLNTEQPPADSTAPLGALSKHSPHNSDEDKVEDILHLQKEGGV